MTIFRRLYRRFKQTPPHRSILFMLAGMYLASVVVFSLAGEKNLSDPFTAFWWLVVTGSTVGYGDFSPQTAVGQAWGVLVILFTVGTVAAIITDIADNEGKAVFRVEIPEDSSNGDTRQTVAQVQRELFQDGSLLLGVERAGNRILAPAGDVELQPGRDAVFVIADARPAFD